MEFASEIMEKHLSLAIRQKWPSPRVHVDPLWIHVNSWAWCLQEEFRNRHIFYKRRRFFGVGAFFVQESGVMHGCFLEVGGFSRLALFHKHGS